MRCCWRCASGLQVRSNRQGFQALPWTARCPLAGGAAGKKKLRRIGAASKSFHVQSNLYGIVKRLLCCLSHPAQLKNRYCARAPLRRRATKNMATNPRPSNGSDAGSGTSSRDGIRESVTKF
jgi:hypothetical protein